MKRFFALVSMVVLTGSVLATGARARSEAVVPVNRAVEAVVLTGFSFPTWSRLPAAGVAFPYPCGSGDGEFGLPEPPIPGCDVSNDLRDAHYGELSVPPDPAGRSGVSANRITGYRWDGRRFVEIPLQVDQRFPYFLANARSDFSFYSGTDEELTYQWDSEAWKKVAGRCTATYDPAADPSLLKGNPTRDPVAAFDDDDEVSFYASDAAGRAPHSAPPPRGAVTSFPSQPGFAPRQEVRLTDPVILSSTFVYLFLTSRGPTLGAGNGHVRYTRDADADRWIDRYGFAPDDPERLGTSHEGYGPNLHGTVCDPDGTVRTSTDRFPRDGMTVTTPTYEVRATGRWMVRSTRVTAPGETFAYGPDLIDRWKGRAFQQSPDSDISVVGFEDEQVNWEANSSLLGERAGPVRAIREVWGADSGTNVTKTEYYYRDFYVFRYHLRVHPIPPDGLYTSWDHNAGVVTRYFNEGMTRLGREAGVAVDGQNDDVGNIDSSPAGNTYFDVTDPTFSLPLAFFDWEQGAGPHGSLVYMFQLNDIKAAQNPAIIPYYRDDSCFDDGTGDDPSRRLFPGEPYAALESNTQFPEAGAYTRRPCYGDPSNGPEYSLEGPWRQGCLACHGVHFLFTNDTDNLFAPKPTTEVDGQQYVWPVPQGRPTNVGDRYANTVKVPLAPTVVAR